MYSLPGPTLAPSQDPTGRNATAPPTSPNSPTRPGRLRGLSYLRNYTHNHILSRESHSGSNIQQRPSISRATSYPSPGASPVSQSNLPPTSPTAQRSTNDLSNARSSNPDNLGSTSGWLPTVGGHSGVSSLATEAKSTATASSTTVLAVNGSSAGTSGSTPSMARTRSATVGGATDMPQVDGSRNESPGTTNGGSQGMAHQLPSIRFTAHQDPRAQRPSLVFIPMARILPSGKEIIKVGRYSERDNQPVQAANVPSAAPVGFKSKVVSRRHCEFWYQSGKWYIKDVKSSSGTFLNHIRLSSPGTESKPYAVNDGDIVQLGIDFKGGEDMIFRCVKIRVELNKGWQNGPTSFNVQSHKRLRELNNLGKASAGGSSQDCSICLGPIAPCQSLFVAPCSHTWHYKCIRVIINGPHWPHFICPNCRTVADLEAELDEPQADGEWEQIEAVENEPPVQAPATTEPVVTARQQRQVETSEQTYVPPPELLLDEFDHQDHSVPSDGDGADTSEDSDAGQREKHVVEAMNTLNLRGPPSLPSSASLNPPDVSSATVPPVDIISRKPVSGVSAATSSRYEQLNFRTERHTTRTPSPNGLPSSLNDIDTSVEGPMTPRNDAGPFVFDGSARGSTDIPAATLLNVATISPGATVPQLPTL